MQFGRSEEVQNVESCFKMIHTIPNNRVKQSFYTEWFKVIKSNDICYILPTLIQLILMYLYLTPIG